MSRPPARPAPPELQRRREEIRRSLTRVGTAALVIVGVVLVLAIAAIAAAWQAALHAQEAQAASQRARDELWKSYLAQSTAGRLSGQVGRKRAGMEAIAAAAQLRPARELRDEYIAHSALVDLEPGPAPRPYPRGARKLSPSPSFTLGAAATGEGEVTQFDLGTDSPVARWSGTNGPIEQLFHSLDGRWIAAVDRKGGLHVLRSNGLAQAWEVPRFQAFDFSPQGNLAAVLGRDGAVRIVDCETGTPKGPDFAPGMQAIDVAFHNNRSLIAIQGKTTAEVWDWTRRERLRTFNHQAPIDSMAFAGVHLAVGDGLGDLEIWDIESGRSQRLPAHRNVINTLQFDHRGGLLVSSSYDNFTRLWDPHTGTLILSTSRGFPLGFSADDTRLAYTTRSGTGQAWGWWNVSTPTTYQKLTSHDGSDGNIWNISLSPDARTLALIKADGLRIFDVASNRLLARRAMARARSVFFLPGGDRIVTCGDNRLTVWSLGPRGRAGGDPVELSVERTFTLPSTQHVDAASLSPDGRRVGLPVSDTQAVIVEIEGPDRLVTLDGADLPKLPVLSPDGRWAVTGTFHGTGSILWDAVTGRRIRRLAPGNANPSFSPDGRFLALAGGTECTLFETGSWTPVRTLPVESSSDLPGVVAFSHDSHILAITRQRQTVVLIDPGTGETLASLAAPEPLTITCMEFSATDSLLAVGTIADHVQFWDLGKLRTELSTAGLDWAWDRAGGTPPPAGDASPRAPTALPTLGETSTRFLTLVGTAVLLGILSTWFVLRRQRQLISAYLEVDKLIEQRTRDLEIAQAEILHSQKMTALGTLAAGIAHDFNNLLSVIRMSNRLITREAGHLPTVAENTEEVDRAVQQGKHVVQSMLGYTTGGSSDRGPVSVPDLVEDTVGLLSKQFLSGITLDLALDAHMPPIDASRGRLEQILLNLVVNASEAMQGKGRLQILVGRNPEAEGVLVLRARSAAEYAALVVADDGPGMEAPIASRIFEPFFTTKNVGAERGTGLGLSMVYSIAEQEGFGIALRTAPGAGARFTILLPLPPTAAPPGENTPSPP